MENKTIADFEENGNLNIEKIINFYQAYVFSILKNGMSNKQDIEEVLSDVFVILWKNYQKLDKQMLVKPYLIGIAKNLMRKKYRIAKFVQGIENIEDYEDKVSDYVDIQILLEENEKSKIVQNAMEEMKEQEKQIFVMFYYQSKKIKEISKELAVSEAKVKVTLHRLRKLIRKKLKKRGYDYGRKS